MPDPYDPATTAAIAGTSQALQNAGNIYAQAKLNKKTREWNEKMYGIQRAAALEDWRMQNEYNHPSAQMARLREAGLNPNLVYGKGADVTAQAVRSNDAPSWNPQAPKMGSTDAFFSHYDFAMKNAQIDNLRKQNTVLQQDALLKAIQGANIAQNTKMGEFDLMMKENLKDIYAEGASLGVLNQKTDIAGKLQEQEIKAAMAAPNLYKALEDILTSRSNRATNAVQRDHLRQQIKNLKQDANIKKLDEKLTSLGVKPGDNFFIRLLAQVIDKLGSNKPMTDQEIKEAEEEAARVLGN